MTFFTSNGGLEDRFNSPHSPRISDPPLFNHSSYLRDPFLSQSSTRTTLHNPASAINDSRNLHRRFTTSNYSSLGQQRRSAFEPASGDIFAVCFLILACAMSRAYFFFSKKYNSILNSGKITVTFWIFKIWLNHLPSSCTIGHGLVC